MLPPPIPLATRPPIRWANVLLGLALVAAGLALIFAVAVAEARWLDDAPWAGAILATDGPAPFEDAFTIYARRVPIENFPEQKAVVDNLPPWAGDSAGMFGLDTTEWFFVVEAPPAALEPVLASGRMPQPEKFEVLAGTLARADSFVMDGRTFTVVGRLRPTTGAAAFAYVTPQDRLNRRLFTRARKATEGWWAPSGIDQLEELDESVELERLSLVLGFPTQRRNSLATVLGLALVAVGGALAQVRLFQGLAARPTGPLRPAFAALADFPFLVALMHILLFGGFFIAMLAGINAPIDHLRLQSFIAYVFTEGGLGYVGDAYLSGNIWRASVATFFNNYVVQVLLYTILGSVLIPFFGFFKNIATFLFTGFVMAPVESGTSARYVYHAVTLTLELEAYVVATIIICLWPYRLIMALRRHAPMGWSVRR
ncbi:MAG: hypothetical protein WD873_08395, partial [Candidatus Hydrogenedentales bacterium]